MLEPGTGVNWCETNYAVTDYIAEFFNTISNLPIIVLPLIGLSLQKEYLKWNKMAKLSFIMMSVTGVMSAYYHATLNLCAVGQILDELSIFWGLMSGIVAWLPAVKGAPDFLRNHVNACRVLAVLLTMVCSAACFLRPSLNCYLMIVFIGVPLVILVSREAQRVVYNDDSEDEKSIVFRCAAFIVLGLIFWILDKLFCPFWLDKGFPFLHAIWHVTMGIGAYHGIILYSYLDAKEGMDSSERKVAIKWVPQIQYVPSIPYVYMENTRR